MARKDDPYSKVNIAYRVVKKMMAEGASRQKIIDQLCYSIQMSPAGASTYYYNAKKRVEAELELEWIKKKIKEELNRQRQEQARKAQQERERQESMARAKVGKAWYQILGVAMNATKAEINASYKKLVRKAHPDLGGSHDEMVELNKARDIGLKLAIF